MAERKNRSIMEVVKAMIHDLPMYLWREAARTIVYVHNKISHKSLGNKTPQEMFTGEKNKFSHLKIFGFTVYIRIPKEKRLKLDPSRKKGLFVGYSEQSKAYRIYILGYRQIGLNRDVTFDEDATLRKSRKNNKDEEEHEAPRATEISKPVRNDEEELVLQTSLIYRQHHYISRC